MKLLVAVLFTALCGTLIPVRLFAQDVTLPSRDRSIEVSGNLLGFDGDYYRVDTVYGELTIDSTGVLCEGPACPNLESYIVQLTFSGSPVIGRVLLPALIEGFARQSDLVTVRKEVGDSQIGYWLQSSDAVETLAYFDIRLTSSDEAFADLLALDADVAMALRVAEPDEITLAKEIGLGVLTNGRQQAFLGMDAVTFVVPEHSGLTSLSKLQLSQVMSGKIRNWAELTDSEPAPLRLYSQPGAVSVLMQSGYDFTSEDAEGLTPQTSPFPEQPGNLAFGLALLSSLPKKMRPIGLTTPCGISHDPNELAVRSGEIAHAFPLVLYRPMRRLPEIGQDFFDYLESSAGQRVVTRAGYVPSAPTIYAFEAVWSRIANALLQAETPEQFEALQNAVRTLKPRELFGGAFRLEVGTEMLDAPSSALLRQLVRLIEYGELDSRQLMFAGFGADGANARMVEQALHDALQPLSLTAQTVSVEFGDIIPLECPETEGAARLNTRVEVWIR